MKLERKEVLNDIRAVLIKYLPGECTVDRMNTMALNITDIIMEEDGTFDEPTRVKGEMFEQEEEAIKWPDDECMRDTIISTFGIRPEGLKNFTIVKDKINIWLTQRELESMDATSSLESKVNALHELISTMVDRYIYISLYQANEGRY